MRRSAIRRHGKRRKTSASARRVSRALAPYALPGGYVNLLDVGEQERVPLTLGSNYEHLLALKRAYDPDEMFQSTIWHIAPSVSYRQFRNTGRLH